MSVGGKRTCKYYRTCGNFENCLKCTSYMKITKSKKSIINYNSSQRHITIPKT